MRNRTILLLVAAGMIVGVAARVYHLDHQTLTHPEFYTPGIPLPDWVRTPAERMTVGPVLEEALLHDKHPPGYYLLTLAWNRVFGTDLFAMRLSSVLFGLLAILAIPWYVRATSGSSRALAAATGVLAVWMLSLHGFHVSWSQQLRPWALVGSLGLITTGLAAALARNRRAGPALAYGVLAALGLWVEYYFWPIFGLQVAWLLLQETRNRDAAPVLSGIGLAGILASPLVIYFFFHTTSQESHIGSATWRHIVALLQFGAVVHRGRAAELLQGTAPIFTILTAGLGATALVLGAMRDRAGEDAPVPAPGPFPQRGFDAVMAVAAILVAGGTWLGFHEPVGDRKIFQLALVVPFLVLGLSAAVRALWPALARVGTASRGLERLRTWFADPAVIVPLGAFAGLAAMSQIVPVFAPYGLVVYAPFVAVIAARGLLRMGRLRLPAIALTFAVFAFSVYQFATSPISAREYQGLARQMIERMQEGEAVLIANAWYAAPMNYYLPPDRYRVMPPPETDADRAALPDTVWVVGFGETQDEIEERMQEILDTTPGRAEIERVSTPTSAAARTVRR